MEHGPLIEALAGKKGARWRIRVIKAGISGNGNFYADKVLREATPLFDGARVFVKGDKEHLAGDGKDFRNLIGRLSAPAFSSGYSADSGEVQADLELIEADGPIALKMREAWDRKMADLFGFSIDAIGRSGAGRVAGKPARIAQSIEKVQSVDLIVEPGAGGQVINLIEARKGATTMEHLTAELIRDIVNASNLPDALKPRFIKRHTAFENVTEAALREAIGAAVEDHAAVTESGHVRGLGDFARPDPRERSRGNDILDAFFDPQHKDHRHAQSIRECYLEITGDRGFTGMTARCDQARLREALGSSTFDDVLGDSVTRRMQALYRTPNLYDVWKPISTIVPVADFRTNERARYGGYGDLPIVAEAAPYPPLASPTDEKATYAIQKRGGTEQITLEMITNDDVGVVRQIPVKMVRSAKRTLSKFVLDLLRTNPTIYDSIALFHATHGNLSTVALAAAELAAARLRMKKQTEMNSADRIGVGPRFLLVPDDLEETAVDLFRRNTQNDKTFVQSLTVEILPVWYWTDTNNFYTAADPMDIDGIEVGFLGGQEEPETFVQDLPTQGSMFSHDQLTYKIRHVYGGAVKDFRGLQGNIVA